MPTNAVSPFVAGEDYVTAVKPKSIALAEHFLGSGAASAVADWDDYHALINPLMASAGLTTIADGITGQQWMDRMNALNARGFATGAATDLIFDRGLYRLNGQPVAQSVIDSYHSRASASWGQNAQGIWQEFPTNQMEVFPGLGYDGREGHTVLNADPLNPRAWTAISSATKANEIGNFLGFSSAVRVTSGDTVAGRIDVAISGGIANSTVYAVRALYVAGTSGRARMVVRSITGAVESAVTGPVGALSALSSAAGIWSNIVNINHGGGIYEVQAIFTATTTGADARFSVGPDSNTAGQDIVVIAGQIVQRPYQVPFGVGTVAADSIVIPAAAAGMAVNPSVTGVTMFWRGTMFASNDPFAVLVDVRAGISDRSGFFRRANGTVGVTVQSSGSNITQNSSPADQTGQECTVFLTCRPDGTTWSKIASYNPQTVPCVLSNLTMANIGIGNLGSGSAPLNAIHRRAGFLPYALSDSDALALFNQINQGL